MSELESTQPDADPCLADATYEEYCAAQDAFPGFVDESGNPTEDDIEEGDRYVMRPND